MRMTRIPDGPTVLAELAPFHRLLYSAFEAVDSEARGFFEAREEEVEPCLHACLVRYGVKQYLRKHGQQVRDEGEGAHGVDYTTRELANNGLALVSGHYAIRILKADGELLPPPGPSRRKQAFFGQQMPLFPELNGDDDAQAVQCNLVIIWAADGHYRFRKLILACPKGGDLSRASVQAHWYEPIPHPAVAVAPPPSDADDIDRTDDLDYSLPDQASDSAEQSG